MERIDAGATATQTITPLFLKGPNAIYDIK
jgi:dihydroorotate dehydrogenase